VGGGLILRHGWALGVAGGGGSLFSDSGGGFGDGAGGAFGGASHGEWGAVLDGLGGGGGV